MIDTHVHVWQPADGHRVLIRERIPALDADFGFERLQPELQRSGVDKVVLVSAAQSFAETERMLGVVERFPDQVCGVIGFLDMDAADFESTLDAAVAAHGALLGLRLPLVVFEDRDWIRRPHVGVALGAIAARGLVAQVLAAPVHLSACADVLAAHPGLKAVIDHAGNPGSRGVDDAAWRDGIAAIGENTTAICKVGEFTQAGNPPADEGRCDEIFAYVLACFGKDRMIFGSNWPVSRLRQDYPCVVAGLLATARREGLDPADFARALSVNASSLFCR